MLRTITTLVLISVVLLLSGPVNVLGQSPIVYQESQVQEFTPDELLELVADHPDTTSINNILSAAYFKQGMTYSFADGAENNFAVWEHNDIEISASQIINYIGSQHDSSSGRSISVVFFWSIMLIITIADDDVVSMYEATIDEIHKYEVRDNVFWGQVAPLLESANTKSNAVFVITPFK